MEMIMKDPHSHNGDGSEHHRHARAGKEDPLSELFDRFNQLRVEWTGFVDQLSGLLQETGRSLNKEGERTVHGMEAQLHQALGLAMKKTKKKGLAVKKYAEHNPWRLASTALAAGLIAGFYLSKRKE